MKQCGWLKLDGMYRGNTPSIKARHGPSMIYESHYVIGQ